MGDKIEYIYNKNGNKPFTDKDKKRLADNKINYDIIFDKEQQKEVKVLNNLNVLISINELSEDKKPRFKQLFNNADYVCLKDVISTLKALLKGEDIDYYISDYKEHKALKNIIPNNHTFNLLAPKIFNTTYKIGKYTSCKSNGRNRKRKFNFIKYIRNSMQHLITNFSDISDEILSCC